MIISPFSHLQCTVWAFPSSWQIRYMYIYFEVIKDMWVNMISLFFYYDFSNCICFKFWMRCINILQTLTLYLSYFYCQRSKLYLDWLFRISKANMNNLCIARSTIPVYMYTCTCYYITVNSLVLYTNSYSVCDCLDKNTCINLVYLSTDILQLVLYVSLTS